LRPIRRGPCSGLNSSCITVARLAMATRFEIALHGASPEQLRAAADEALDEVERLEQRLSYFLEGSEIRRLNLQAAAGSVRVDAEVFQLLRRAKRLSEATQGGFDPTIAPLMRAWGFRGAAPAGPEEIAHARSLLGMNLVELDETRQAVRFAKPGVALDLGALGKGYAVERALLILQEAGIEHALIHGGTSSVHGLGRQPDGSPWKIALEAPSAPAATTQPPSPPRPWAVVPLQNRSLSVSAIWGRRSKPDGNARSHGHIINPLTGAPESNAVLAAALSDSGADVDALSTGLMVLGEAGLNHLPDRFPNAGFFLASQSDRDGTIQLAHHAFPGVLSPS